MELILASASPRRAELLSAAGFAFTVHPADVDERLEDGEAPVDAVRRLSLAKARQCPAGASSIVIAADTLVTVDGVALGKPTDEADAGAMLRRLAGRAHVVLTGLTCRRGETSLSEVCDTLVWLEPMSDALVAWYVASGEPMDKAGAYGIQGLASRFVTRVEGSYSNVVGLPVAALSRMLDQLGYALLR